MLESWRGGCGGYPGPAEYRDILLRSIRLILNGLYPHPGGLQEIYPFRLEALDAERLGDLMLQARTIIRRAVVVPLLPEPGAVDAARGNVALQNLLATATAAAHACDSEEG